MIAILFDLANSESRVFRQSDFRVYPVLELSDLVQHF